jgi:hypothetical protein
MSVTYGQKFHGEKHEQFTWYLASWLNGGFLRYCTTSNLNFTLKGKSFEIAK